ncbi:hypothetical protein RJ640_004921 [Escallonia rubra]|uniref:25S rRNA (uridine-N(3))-methyltransferase BMT5-like domain-containing protein n=1 Tax=Escallonia rubra TaxID=112253 RepID=A0AA88RQ84_9ASTE|nr:hypothetical protein RJ640_004921 [Escallonia rubra]
MVMNDSDEEEEKWVGCLVLCSYYPCYATYRMHRSLVHGFFRNASGMLRAYGEIHVNHKTTAPFCHWNIEELAYWNSLVLIERVGFRKEDYPGYKNKRGSGSKCDDPFHLGECSTFKFRLSTTARKMTTERRSLDLPSNKLQQVQEIPTYVPQQSSSFELSRPFPNSISCISGCLGSVEFLPNVNISSECSRTFSGYFNHVVGTFGLTDYDVRYYVHEALRLGYERYVAEGPGQSLTGYITILQELQHLSSLRSAWLRRMLLLGRNTLRQKVLNLFIS